MLGTPDQQLIYLRAHWGSRYDFTKPEAPGGKWRAVAKFGQWDQIEEWSPVELLEEVRHHYAAHKPHP